MPVNKYIEPRQLCASVLRIYRLKCKQFNFLSVVLYGCGTWSWFCLLGANQMISAQQAKLNNYKNTKLELLKTNAAIWFIK